MTDEKAKILQLRIGGCTIGVEVSVIRHLITGAISLAVGVLIGIALADFADQHRIAKSEQAADQLSAELGAAKQILAERPAAVNSDANDRIVAIGRVEEGEAQRPVKIDAELIHAEALGATRAEILGEIQRVFATKAIPSDHDDFQAFMVADGVGLQFLGAGPSPLAVIVLIPEAPADLGGRVVGTVLRVLIPIEAERAASLVWFLGAMNKVELGFSIMGSADAYTMQLEQLEIGNQLVYALRVVRKAD